MDLGTIMNILLPIGINLLKGILILVIGFLLIHWVIKLLDHSKLRSRLEPPLWQFVRNLIKLILAVVVILSSVNALGIQLTSVLTLLASAGVAVSLALQGALSNLVGGMTLLILKPITAGEFVKIGDYEGTVKSIGAFYTDLTTFDNRRVSLPNNTLTNTPIVNYTREGTRRVDVTYSVSYASDIDHVYKVLNDMLSKNKSILDDPAPAIVLQKCSDSSVDYTLRAWVRSADYWSVFFYLNEFGKRALDDAGIEIPFPQMDVHIK